MGLPAARLGDLHVCPGFTGPVLHVGGPVVLPACLKVLVGGLPAARMTSQTAHGGMVALGCFKVLIS